MQHLNDLIVQEAASHGRLEAVPCEVHRIDTFKTGTTCYRTFPDGESTLASSLAHSPGGSVDESDRLGTLSCIYQRHRPRHVSGKPDKLPFSDTTSIDDVFTNLSLPSAYLQLADGSLSIVHSAVSSNQHESGEKYEFVAYCITKQGDWSMALTHHNTKKHTSVFWSVDQRVNSTRLLGTLSRLQNLACHPMLLPCIMFADTLRTGLERRHNIKANLRILEQEIQTVNRDASLAANAQLPPSTVAPPQTLERLFELLQSCRREQASREGRYELWRSFHAAVAEGLQYSERAFAADDPAQKKFAAAHMELTSWTSLTWRKFESLKARDMDHVERINNISDILYNIVHLRDSRVQVDIARASKRDSEDMKFITLLGAVFLPASLVASILNVPEFQFLPGPKLFGFYIAVTVPLAGILVTLLLTRSVWKAWWTKAMRYRWND